MPRFFSALILTAVVGLAACTNADRFGPGSGDDDFGYGPGGIHAAALGDPNDPRSPAYFQQSVGDRVFFTTDSSSLNTAAQRTLDAQARWLNDNRDRRIVIEGHADERGTREYNVALGARRANAVQEYLHSQGVALNRMRTVSYGKERPVEACPEQRCWDLNRRAVTVITAAAGA
ncbi:peptidoglycan-associated lipoprotein Pal [Alkalilacustris brevis]|uniref:peptidoglycan-associated lipoprotein Pal n=1 Tax=Alkalilacustris brevis TaxID=2026338 RepID=UPI000E0DEDF4|nr:peptidoglycan-associated lipoprotein Pal [Alkalilacustris brevis]